MAPIRRYLRITKYSVIECRIYLDNPALAQTWLLNPRKPVLPRVIESVRPLVLPKLREERERSRTKRSTKKKAIKDLVVEGKSVLEHAGHACFAVPAFPKSLSISASQLAMYSTLVRYSAPSGSCVVTRPKWGICK